MKKLVLAAMALGLLYSTNTFAQTEQNQTTTPQEGQEWQKQEGNKFQGANDVWYKIEDDQVMSSKDGKNWEMVQGNTFQAQDGSQFRYYDGKLFKSEDGQTWKQAEEWSDPSGKTFTIDEEGNVMTKKETPGSGQSGM